MRRDAWRGDGDRNRVTSRALAVLYTSIFVVIVGYGITLTVLPDCIDSVRGLRGLDHRLVAIHLGVRADRHGFRALGTATAALVVARSYPVV